MIKRSYIHRISAVSLAALLLAAASLSGCAGEDFTPVYFPPPQGEEGAKPATPPATSQRQCAISFTSQLCVSIKGENIKVGADGEEQLCTEVPAFPFHISGNEITINGNEFPDLNVEGHGLPAPITINARGDKDGTSNIGKGTIDASGNITIDGFSLFIVALGIVGEVPDLTLTTGATEELEFLPSIQGSPPDASGTMTLVTATTLGSVIEAADKYLMGASLTASFKGSISPALSGCGEEAARTIEVKRIYIGNNGAIIESPLADEKIMEISSGTYIPSGDSDIGPSYETIVLFRVKNIGNKEQKLSLPQKKGAFYLSAMVPLTGTLAPQQFFTLTVKFRPTSTDTKPGKVAETLAIGNDSFQLVATALSKSGNSTVSVVGDDGTLTTPNVQEVPIGSSEVPANMQRKFFLCTAITCENRKAFTNCGACADPTTMPCELLTVSTDGKPVSEVDAKCQLTNPSSTPLYTIDLKGSTDLSITAQKQVLAIRNTGVADIRITAISIEDIKESKSLGQFSVPANAILVADHFADIQKQVANALANKSIQGAKLPITLPPYQKGFKETTAYVVVTYMPTDLIGSDGNEAGVGSKATDKATLRIKTDKGDITTNVSGTTTIVESPELELFFKTTSGTKQIAEGNAFPFKGITTETLDMAVPLFLKTADSSKSTLRVTGISISGTDAKNFRWLDTKEKITQVSPPSGKGLRCSIPTVDESTGKMTGESFDLNPVSLASPGFDLAPGAYKISSMPLFGCVDFHRESGETNKASYEAILSVDANELNAAGLAATNPDGSLKKTTLTIKLLASTNALSGPFVLRVTQTMAAILNPDFPGLSAVSSKYDMMSELASGRAKETDLQVFTGAIILDPFDELVIKTSDGKEVLSKPNDGSTAVFRRIDTHPVSEAYGVEGLFDYANLMHDASRPEGSRGIFEDFPGLPENARTNGWRIFTSTLSWPGPLGAPDKRPNNPSDCLIVNPCTPDGLKYFTDAGAAEAGKGACAFFYASGGRYSDSPAFLPKESGGEYAPLCSKVDQPQNLKDMNKGHYAVDGSLTFEDIGLRFFGPTYFHNPGGPLDSKPPMDAVFHVAFTTGILKPPTSPNDLNVLPDTRIDLSKNEYKLNLDDKASGRPAICPTNTNNRTINGNTYSTWHYLDGLLFKDEAGTIPAGCPESGGEFSGGQAFLRGKNIDPETGMLTVVAGAKFGSSDDLTFAFQNVMFFIVIKGWLCNPAGKAEDFEGARCYDAMFNDRDAKTQTSIMK